MGYEYDNSVFDVMFPFDKEQGEHDPEVMEKIRQIVAEMAQFANQFDRIIVSGRSRLLTRTLLQLAGVDPRKFVVLGNEDNTQLYKGDTRRYRTDAAFDDEVIEKYEAFEMDQRVNAFGRNMEENFLPEREKTMSSFLQRVGVTSDQTVCYVDDTSTSRRKAGRMMALLNRCRDRGLIKYFGGAVLFDEQSVLSIDGQNNIIDPAEMYYHPEPTAVFNNPEISKRFKIPSLLSEWRKGNNPDNVFERTEKMKKLQKALTALEVIFKKFDPKEITEADRKNLEDWKVRKETKQRITAFLKSYIGQKTVVTEPTVPVPSPAAALPIAE
jgi:hypothetical protein